MNVARSAAEVLSQHTTLALERVDRMYLNVYVPLLQTAAGAAHFFRAMRGAAWRGRRMVFTTGRGRRRRVGHAGSSKLVTTPAQRGVIVQQPADDCRTAPRSGADRSANDQRPPVPTARRPAQTLSSGTCTSIIPWVTRTG